MTALENYRWDYGDTASLIETVQARASESAANLEQIDVDLTVVSEEQYLLANAAKTTHQALCLTLDSIILELEAGRSDKASELYYGSAETCGMYLRQYTQQLLERACLDHQDAYDWLSRLNGELKQVQTVTVLASLLIGSWPSRYAP